MEVIMNAMKKGAPSGTRRARSERGISEIALLKIGTVLLSATFVMTLCVFSFCDEKDEELARAGIELDELIR